MDPASAQTVMGLTCVSTAMVKVLSFRPLIQNCTKCVNIVVVLAHAISVTFQLEKVVWEVHLQESVKVINRERL